MIYICNCITAFISSVTFTAVIIMLVLRFKYRPYNNISVENMLKEYEICWIKEFGKREELAKLLQQLETTKNELDYTKIKYKIDNVVLSCREEYSKRWQIHVAFETEFGSDKYLIGFKVEEHESIHNAFKRYKKEHPEQPKRLNILEIFKNYITVYSKRRKGNVSEYYFYDMDVKSIKLI